jgi:polar amino acid transport system substrate-binding protein
MSPRSTAVLLGSLLVAALSACSSTKPIVVGSDLDNVPFAYMDKDGKAAGRDVDMMIAIAHMLDRELVWKRMEFDQLLPAAESGRVDVVCATLGVTPERSAQVDFSRPYFKTELVVLVREAPGQPESLRDLVAKKVAASPGTTSQRAISRLLPDAVGVFAPDRERTDMQRLLEGEVDAIVMDGPAAEAAMAAQPGKLRRIPGLFTPEDYALAMPKNRDALRSQIDDCLRTLQISGNLEVFNGKYGLREISTSSKPD